MRPEFAILNQNFVSSNEAILAEDERALQNAKNECICYLDPDSREMYFQSLKLGADDATAAEESSETQGLPANVETDQSKRKKNAVDKMEQSFKFLKSPNDTFPRDESTNTIKALQSTTLRQTWVMSWSNQLAIFSLQWKVQQASFRSIINPTLVLDPYDSLNVIDLRIERNLWSKSRDWRLRKGKRTWAETEAEATGNGNGSRSNPRRSRVDWYTVSDIPEDAWIEIPNRKNSSLLLWVNSQSQSDVVINWWR